MPDSLIPRTLRAGGSLWMKRLSGRDFVAWLVDTDGRMTRDLHIDQILEALGSSEYTWHRGPGATLWLGIDELVKPETWTEEDERAWQLKHVKRHRGGPPVTRYDGAIIELPPLGDRVLHDDISEAIGARIESVRYWGGRNGVTRAGKGWYRVDNALIVELRRRGVAVTVAESAHA
ncbi:MAG: hypothetical protein AAF170_08480 [Bacteroidota bacterium]